MRSLRQLSLRQQHVSFFGVVSALALLVFLIAVLTSARSIAGFQTTTTGYLRIHDLRTGLSDTGDLLRAYLRDGSAEAANQVLAREPYLRRIWNDLRRVGFSDLGSRLEMNAVRAGLDAYRAAVLEVMAMYEADDPRFGLQLLYTERVAGYVDGYLENLLSIQLDRGQSDLAQIRLRHQQTLLAAAAGGLAVGLLLMAFALLFARSVTRPLASLVREAHALAGGDFDRPALTVPESRDLREVALAFNTMTSGIRGLVRDLQDKQELQARLHEQELATMSMERLVREAQLVALQSQMNPHFLFNTLNSIARTARREDAGESEQLIRDLSRVLRYILRNPRSVTSIADELRMVEDYLRLQSVRFGSRLRVVMDVDPDARDVPLPPLVLQPLVENAVIHGIEPKEEGGTVTITARLAPDRRRLTIRIADDGIGMGPQLLAGLAASDPDTTSEMDTDGERLGLRNVRARLQLLHGNDQQFTVDSRPGGGTTIEIVIPRGAA